MKPTDKTPMPAPKMKSCLLINAEVAGMLEALRKTNAFTIARQRETVTVTHNASRHEVFHALSKSGSGRGPWIARIASNLFAQ